jgi:outer membrane protein assembly factor BamB
MKRFILLVLFMSIVYSQEKNIELEVIYEKTFDEPIVDVIFDTATVKIEEAKRMGWKENAFSDEEKSKGKVLVSYPKVVLISRGRELTWLPDERRGFYETKRIQFYDKNGKIIKIVDIKEETGLIHFSWNKKYMVIATYPSENGFSSKGGIVYDINGNKIWEVKNVSPLAISNEGYIIATSGDWGGVPVAGGNFFIYDTNGKLITIIKNPDSTKVMPYYAQFSKDGEYALLIFNMEDKPTIFFLITKKGEILWRKDLPEYRYSRWDAEIKIYQNLGVIGGIYKGGMNAFYIDWEGNLKWIIPLKTLGYCCCILDTITGRIYFSSSSGYLWCFDKDTGNLIWKQKITEEGNYFIEMYLHDENLILNGANAGQATWVSSSIFVFDKNTGELKNKMEYPKETFLLYHNNMFFITNTVTKKIEGLRIFKGEK